MNLDDLTLVRRYKEGDEQAFRALVQRYERKVFAVAFGMLKDREEALDISQEAFVRVHQNLGRFQGDSAFYTWLYRIVRNLAIDRLRSRKSEASAVDDSAEAQERAQAGVVATHLGTNPQRGALRRELAEKMNEALAKLSGNHREILLLREVEGMSYDELATTLEIPKGTVMSRLFHARAKMQQLLATYLEGDRLDLASGEGEG